MPRILWWDPVLSPWRGQALINHPWILTASWIGQEMPPSSWACHIGDRYDQTTIKHMKMSRHLTVVHVQLWSWCGLLTSVHWHDVMIVNMVTYERELPEYLLGPREWTVLIFSHGFSVNSCAPVQWHMKSSQWASFGPYLCRVNLSLYNVKDGNVTMFNSLILVLRWSRHHHILWLCKTLISSNRAVAY